MPVDMVGGAGTGATHHHLTMVVDTMLGSDYSGV
jgi:hypothetical protein